MPKVPTLPSDQSCRAIHSTTSKPSCGIVDDQSPDPLTGIAAADVIGDDDIAPLGVIAAFAAGAVLVIGRAGQEGGEPPRSRRALPGRPIDVGCQADSVAHRDHHVLLDDDDELRRPHAHARRLSQHAPRAQPDKEDG